ncbi:hypothetical protein ACM739_29560 [Pseudomonas aeruginosa]
MTNSRAKGTRVELDFAKLCFEHLGIKVERNLEQSRAGGYDLTGLPGWAPEIKGRAEFPSKAEFLRMWAQTLDQAGDALKPLLAIKANRRGWTCFIDAAELRPDIYEPGKSWICLEPEDFFQYVRSTMPVTHQEAA